MLVSDGRVAGYVRGPDDEGAPDDECDNEWDDKWDNERDGAEPAEKKRGFLRRLFGRK